MPRKAKRRIAKKKAVRKVIHKSGPKPTQQGPTTGVDAAASRNEMLKTLLAKGLGGPSVVTQSTPHMDPKTAAMINSASNQRADFEYEKSAKETARNLQELVKLEKKRYERQQKEDETMKRLKSEQEELQEKIQTRDGLNRQGQLNQQVEAVLNRKRQVEKQIKQNQEAIKGNPLMDTYNKAKDELEDLQRKNNALIAFIQSDEFKNTDKAIKTILVNQQKEILKQQNNKLVIQKGHELQQLELDNQVQKEALEQYNRVHGAADKLALKNITVKKQQAELENKQANEDYQRAIQAQESIRKTSHQVEDLQRENTILEEETTKIKTKVNSQQFKTQLKEQQKQLMLQQDRQKELEQQQSFYIHRRDKLHETQTNIQKVQAETEDIEAQNKFLTEQYNTKDAQNKRKQAAEDEAKANQALRQAKTMVQKRREQNEANYDILVAAEEAKQAQTRQAQSQREEIARMSVATDQARKTAEASRDLTKAQQHVSIQQHQLNLQQQLADQGALGQPEAVAQLAVQLQNTQHSQDDLKRIDEINKFNMRRNQFIDNYEGLDAPNVELFLGGWMSPIDINKEPTDKIVQRNKVWDYLWENVPTREAFPVPQNFLQATEEYFADPQGLYYRAVNGQ